jgi:hypothetical protein
MAALVHFSDDKKAPNLEVHFPFNRARLLPAGRITASLDVGVQTGMPKRLLAQKLIEIPAACKTLLEALSGEQPDMEKSMIILLSCCQLNVQLAMQCNKLGAIKRVLQLLQQPGLDVITSVRAHFWLQHELRIQQPGLSVVIRLCAAFVASAGAENLVAFHSHFQGTMFLLKSSQLKLLFALLVRTAMPTLC